MKTISSLFRLRIGAGDTDAFLLRVVQVTCFIVAAFVFVAGLLKVSRLDLTEAQLFGAVQQVVQTALLFCIFGLLLHRKSNAA
jgi:hypothetical protein